MFNTVKQAREHLTAQGFYVRGIRWYDITTKTSGQSYVVSNFRGGICYDGFFKHENKDHFMSWVNRNFKRTVELTVSNTY